MHIMYDMPWLPQNDSKRQIWSFGGAIMAIMENILGMYNMHIMAINKFNG